MNFIKLTSISLLASTLLLANSSIIEKAKTARLTAIPTDKAALMKLIDPKNTISDEKVALGKQLFFEPRLSKSSLISCNTCHNLATGGVDGLAAAIGDNWTVNPHHLNSPTVYNTVFYDAQFWDGRSHNLEDQAQGPMQATPEMASPKSLVVARINSIPEYVAAFKKAYGEKVKIDFTTITATIGLFERTLVTPSRFDDFLHGKENALTVNEKEGLKLFIDKGCASCHNGIALGGSMQAFEIAAKYKFANIGDFKGDKNHMVKTPTLRNITQTAPYFHNGAIWNLADAVKEMGSVQLGIKVSDEEADKIVIFFNALEGKKPTIVYPQLPKSISTTPKPMVK